MEETITMDNDDNFRQNPEDQDNPLADMKSVDQIAADEETPFSPPSDVTSHVGPTEPPTDSNNDLHEQYDAGTDAASGTDRPLQESDDEESTKIS